MQLICLSISHHQAPVEVREGFAIEAEALADTLAASPLRSGGYECIAEAVILSTCNRFELYALISCPDGSQETPQLARELGYRFFWELAGFPDQAPAGVAEPYLRYFSGQAAAEHLFEVAGGLDSIAIGETQILGQVSRALDTAQEAGAARHVMSSLFRSAIHAGKRVRDETGIGRRPTSLSAVAVQMAEQLHGSLASKRVLVIGAGKMGGYAAAALRERGAREIWVTNRSPQRAQELADQFGATVLPYEELHDGLSAVDIVFTSTASPQPIISPEMAARALAGRRERPLALIDLAVPRNVEPAVRAVAGVRLVDMDDLQDFVNNAGLSGLAEIAQARAIVAEEAAAYGKLLAVAPFIGELHRKVEKIRQQEVERSLRRLGVQDPQVCQQIEMLSRSLVRKILHEPTMHLRTETNRETLNDYVDILARLFDLEENPAGQLLQKEETWQ